ncbi:MAG: 50S ribosomal protein L29 [Chloroflexi bacterium]|nr:50S ribosomal protein L29 [Chloroflexota bacterium]
MNISEVRQLDDDELNETLSEQQRAMMNLRFRAATLQLTDSSELKKTRRDIARMKTVMTEREFARRLQA